MLTKNLEIILQLNKDGKMIVGVYEPESGVCCKIHNVFSPDEHPEFNDQIGNEIYSWLTLMADEMEEENDVIMG